MICTRRLYSILLKEDFRKFLVLSQTKSKYLVIDNPDYTKLPYSIGCFLDGKGWHCYNVDERQQVYDDVVLSDQIEAYQEFAKRISLDYRPNISFDTVDKQFKEKSADLLPVLNSAIETLAKLLEIYNSVGRHHGIESDLEYLMNAKKLYK